MTFTDPDFSDPRKFGLPYDEPPRERGCFFYGCIIAIVLSLLLIIAIVVISFLTYQWFGRVVEQYTATAPRDLPVVKMPEPERAAVKKRVEAFREALKEDRPVAPLVLSADDINALIEDNPKLNLKGKVYITIEGDRMKGQVSLPLNDLPTLGLTKGRYLNGEAEFDVQVRHGRPFVTIEELEVNGQRPSDEIMRSLSGQNLFKDAKFKPEVQEDLDAIEGVEIKDGRMIITPRNAIKSSAETPESLPADVLAPPESKPSAPIDGADAPKSSP